MRVEIVSETVSLKGKLIPARSESSQKVSDNQFLANFRAALSGKDSFFQLARFHRGIPGRMTAEYRSLEEARASIARWIKEYNHDRPHRGIKNRTPHEAFLAFTAVLNSETLTV